MRKTFNYLLLLFTVITLSSGFASCSDDEDEGDSVQLDTPVYETDAAKYVVMDTNSSYESIELTASGNYIITLNPYASASKNFADIKTTVTINKSVFKMPSLFKARSAYSPILYGTFTKVGDNEYILNGYGSLVIVEDAENNAFSIQVTPTNGETEQIQVSKQNANISGAMSDKLCRTWEFSKIRVYAKVNGRTMFDVSGSSFEELMDNLKEAFVDMGGDPSEVEDFYMDNIPQQVIFTKSGTYMVVYSENQLAVSTWCWVDEASGLASYSWFNDLNDPDGLFNVAFDNGHCLLTEKKAEDGESYEVGTVYTMTEVK